MPRGKANSPETYQRQLSGLKQFQKQPSEIARRTEAWPAKPVQPRPRALFTIETRGNGVYASFSPRRRVLLFRLVADEGRMIYAVAGRKKVPLSVYSLSPLDKCKRQE